MIKLRKRPKQPDERRVLESVEIEIFPYKKVLTEVYEDGDEEYDFEQLPRPSLAEVVKHFEDEGIDISKVYPEYYYCGGEMETWYIAPKFLYVVMESQMDYERRIEQHKQELKEYQDWYKKNKEKIKATKAAIKRQKDEEKAEAKLARKKKSLKKKQEEISKELEKLEQ